jgi:hypothetical protein
MRFKGLKKGQRVMHPTYWVDLLTIALAAV